MVPLQVPGGIEVLVVLLIALFVLVPVVVGLFLLYRTFLNQGRARRDIEAADEGDST